MSLVEFLECKHMVDRVEKIDGMFAEAGGWGSWMVECANEREALVNKLAERGVMLEHKNRARSASGGRVD